MNGKLVRMMIFLGGLPLVGFILLTYCVVQGITISLDERIMSYIRSSEHPVVTKGMMALSFIGNTWPVVIISLSVLLVIYKLYRKRDEVILFVIVSLGSMGLNLLLKYIFKRERPFIDPLIIETGYSYPSGHSMAALTLYGAITFLVWRHISNSMGRACLVVFSVVMIIAMGVSRIYLGVHYPSDVLGAYLVSGTWLFLTISVYQYRKDRQTSY
ncbi:phosphatase PAP2 family protein [Halalkalibacter sp. APA_J-10(15)]|uniref:phosphatase PAP2 family protein n=1 Tax=Halalkalibacter sp. APA_J-10(15) TaxID=2933805 RepID=UPI001FF300AE|nr:phosphatase PAP2 family protein [Halalkalibacter sp. APA_J-10(15)]MCK0469856.1 phosphatase PAP2 family protein [Halalkalibacter sp. APA_J-10(15)]